MVDGDGESSLLERVVPSYEALRSYTEFVTSHTRDWFGWKYPMPEDGGFARFSIARARPHLAVLPA